MRRINITIREGEFGWNVCFGGYPMGQEWSAVDAITMVHAQLQELADGGMSTVAMVEWIPTTEIGLSVVKVLAGERGARDN